METPSMPTYPLLANSCYGSFRDERCNCSIEHFEGLVWIVDWVKDDTFTECFVNNMHLHTSFYLICRDQEAD